MWTSQRGGLGDLLIVSMQAIGFIRYNFCKFAFLLMALFLLLDCEFWDLWGVIAPTLTSLLPCLPRAIILRALRGGHISGMRPGRKTPSPCRQPSAPLIPLVMGHPAVGKLPQWLKQACRGLVITRIHRKHSQGQWSPRGWEIRGDITWRLSNRLSGRL